LCKTSGNLFLYALQQLGVSPEEVEHLGDNVFSDVTVPLNLGIKSLHYPEGHYTDNEKALLADDHDNQVLSISLVSSMRHYRLSRQSYCLSVLNYEFLGPFLVTFALWILQSAQKKGIKKLFFFSRDCQALCQVATSFAHHYEIECEYLYVSRQALFLPSAIDTTPEELTWLFRRFEQPKLSLLLSKLELDINEWLDDFEELHEGRGGDFLVANLDLQKKFWSILQKHDIRGAVTNTIQKRAHAAEAYFDKMGVYEHHSIGVVDLGWFGTCQEAFTKIIRRKSLNMTVTGFYLGLSRDRLSPANTGEMLGLFEEPPRDSPHSESFKFVFDHITKIEHIVGHADHPSIFGYENGDAIFYDNSVHSLNQNEKIKSLRNEIDVFVQVFLENHTHQIHADSSFRRITGSLLTNFWHRPSRESVEFLATFNCSVNQNGADAYDLVCQSPIRAAFFQLLPMRLRRTVVSSYSHTIDDWPVASRVAAGNITNIMLNCIELLKVSKQALRKYFFHE
jgi:predicted HAD superfamily hydrolase